MPTTTRQAQVVAAWLAGPKGLTLSGDALAITDERGRDVTAQYVPEGATTNSNQPAGLFPELA